MPGIGGEDDNYATVMAAIEGKIAAATKVEASETNGNIKINGEETTVYTHPTTSAVAAGFKKVGNDDKGHVVLGADVTKQDIVALGIPAQDTTYSDVVAGGRLRPDVRRGQDQAGWHRGRHRSRSEEYAGRGLWGL